MLEESRGEQKIGEEEKGRGGEGEGRRRGGEGEEKGRRRGGEGEVRGGEG